MDFQDLYWPNIRLFWEQNGGRGDAMLTHNKLVFTFGPILVKIEQEMRP